MQTLGTWLHVLFMLIRCLIRSDLPISLHLAQSQPVSNARICHSQGQIRHPLPWYKLQNRHFIPALFDQTSENAWLYIHPWITCQENKPSTSMTNIACDSKLCSVEVINAFMSRKLDGNQACGCLLCPGSPRI